MKKHSLAWTLAGLGLAVSMSLTALPSMAEDHDHHDIDAVELQLNAGQKWQALALFSTFAGNLTIFGSIANLIVVEIAQKHHIEITAREYFRVGFPLTVFLTFLCFIWLDV